MGETRNLVILATIMSAASLVISTWSLWPSCKDGFAKFRDAVLWVAFIFVVVGVANYYWRAHAWSGPAWKGVPTHNESGGLERAHGEGELRPRGRDEWIRDYSRVDRWTSYARSQQPAERE